MGIILIILGILIWHFWARDYNRGKQDPIKSRMIHDHPLGCLPWVIAFAFIGLGVYLLAN